MSEDFDNIPTQLLTLLNVSATRNNKRKWTDTFVSSQKLNKKRVVVPEEIEASVTTPEPTLNGSSQAVVPDDDALPDTFAEHFAPDCSVLTTETLNAIKEKKLCSSRKHIAKRPYTLYNPEPLQELSVRSPIVIQKLQTSSVFSSKRPQQPIFEQLSSYQDILLHCSDTSERSDIRSATSLHILNHISKIRRRILKNNERISKADVSVTDALDQGFTRPSVLVVLPFRSFALKWMETLTSLVSSSDFQIENHARFTSHFGLPPNAVDKLAQSVGVYPQDHIDMFSGNIDDNFRVGVKLTRKSLKPFSEFYSSDIIVASPLGLRMTIEKEKNTDFLSSIEILVMDQLDALAMQNWKHVELIMERLNAIPKDSHNADFSRIKPWYLDGNARHLRQSILISPFETPDMRALFNSLQNVSGKLRPEIYWPALQIPDGVEPKFEQFDCANSRDEPDKRFEFFTTRVLPAVLKSAVQSANIIIFIPSYFDFVRVRNHIRKLDSITYDNLSEYASNQEISRARQSFFVGNTSFLLVTERFHFFRRYKLRGIRNLLFYAPPEHAQFFSEFCSYPFLDDNVEPSDITCRVIVSRYDRLQVERLVGTKEVTNVLRL